MFIECFTVICYIYYGHNEFAASGWRWVARRQLVIISRSQCPLSVLVKTLLPEKLLIRDWMNNWKTCFN